MVNAFELIFKRSRYEGVEGGQRLKGMIGG